MHHCPRRRPPSPRSPVVFGLGLAVTLVCVTPDPAAAHGAGHGVVDRQVTPGGVAIEFLSASGEPLADAPFRIFAPEANGDIPFASGSFASGRTDRLGRAAFVPDRSGTWQVAVSDGSGHEVMASVAIDPDLTASPEPQWRRWLLRASLIANVVALTLVIYGWRRGRAFAAPPHGHDHGHHHDHAHSHHGHSHDHGEHVSWHPHPGRLGWASATAIKATAPGSTGDDAR